jgi:hypothetical protein
MAEMSILAMVVHERVYCSQGGIHLRLKREIAMLHEDDVIARFCFLAHPSRFSYLETAVESNLVHSIKHH